MTGRFFPRAVKGLVRTTLSDSFSTLPRLSILPIWFSLAGKYLIACARCTQISTAVRIAIEAACDVGRRHCGDHDCADGVGRAQNDGAAAVAARWRLRTRHFCHAYPPRVGWPLGPRRKRKVLVAHFHTAGLPPRDLGPMPGGPATVDGSSGGLPSTGSVLRAAACCGRRGRGRCAAMQIWTR